MKIKLLNALFVFTMCFASVPRASAADNSAEVISDVALVRPGCFIATILGAAVFVVALPIAAASHSVHKTAHTLVVNPAKATFTRPLGDYSSLED